jgi:hypothetical protein
MVRREPALISTRTCPCRQACRAGIACCVTLSTVPCSNPYFVQLKVSILISAGARPR